MASNLADILVSMTLETEEFSRKLKQTGQELKSFQNQVNQISSNMSKQFSDNMGDMSESMTQINTASVASSKIISQGNNNIGQSMRSTAKTSKFLARTLGTDFLSVQKVVRSATEEYERFGGMGRRVSRDIKDEFSGLPKHLQRYVQRLREAGRSTEAFTKLNKMYSQGIIENFRRSNDYMQKRTTQSKRLMDSFAKDTNLAPLTNQFLNLGNRMEKTAKKGRVLNIALQRIGNDTSLKNLKDQMKFVQQGVMRARGAFIGFGVLSLGALAGMIYLASIMDERVSPAFENFKETWLDAFEPWIEAMATSVVRVLDFFSAINELINKFSEAHPVAMKLIGAFLLLTMVLGALLAPLAVTGIWTQGVAASFAALWAIIQPFVLGMLAVVGVAMAVAGAMVALWYSIEQLWKNSQAFREAWISIWERIKNAVVVGFVNPVKQAWDNLKLALSNLIAVFTGGSGTMSNLWTFLGDHIAVVVAFVADSVLPILEQAISFLGTIVSGVINGIVAVVNWMAEMWSVHGETIKTVVGLIWMKIQEVFEIISTYLMSKMPQIQQIIGDGFELIRTIIDFVMTYIVPIVMNAFNVIWSVIQTIMPFVVAIIVDTWNNIMAVIDSTLNIIQNLIQLFSNILKGNWTGAWENVKNILKNAVTLVWNLLQLWFVGKIFKLFKMLPGKIGGFLKTVGGKMLAPFKKGYNKVKEVLGKFTKNVKEKFNKAKEAVKEKLKSVAKFILDPFKNGWNKAKTWMDKLKNGAKEKFNSAKTSVKTALSNVANTITTPFKNGWNKAKTWMDNLKNGAKSKFNSAKSAVKTALSNVANFITTPFKNGWNKAKSVIDSLKNGVKSKFNTAKNSVKTAFNNVKELISKPFKDGWNKIKDIPGKIKDAFNKLKIKIPKPKLPKINISSGSKKVAGVSIPYPKFSVDWNAKGNIFNGASILGGNQGVGEAGAEAVMPIQHKRYMKPFASSVASHLQSMAGQGDSTKSGGDKTEIIFNQPVIIREDADIQRIVDELEKRKRIKERSQGIFSY